MDITVQSHPSHHLAKSQVLRKTVLRAPHECGTPDSMFWQQPDANNTAQHCHASWWWKDCALHCSLKPSATVFQGVGSCFSGTHGPANPLSSPLLQLQIVLPVTFLFLGLGPPTGTGKVDCMEETGSMHAHAPQALLSGSKRSRACGEPTQRRASPARPDPPAHPWGSLQSR